MTKNMREFFTNQGWSLIENGKKASKTYNFISFIQAFAWMTEVAFKAEKIDHHPDWTNVYNKVNVILTTHDKNNLTDKDFLLAEVMEKSFEKYRKKNA